jgi:phosphoglycolate phosphatase
MVGRRYLAVGFDMDGTLLRTDVNYSKLCKVVYDGMVSAGVPESVLDLKEGSKYNLDRGMRYLSENGLSDGADIPDVMKENMKAVELENAATARPYEGGERMLEHLKKKGYGIGVLTRGSRAYASKALTSAGVAGMVDALVCRDDHPEAEAKPSPLAMDHLAKGLGVRSEDMLYLGDIKGDYLCARDSGAGFIGVLTKYTKEDWASVDKGIRTIDTVTDLIDIL